MLRASFEETVEVFMNAAVFSQYDVLNGVTENVMLGQLGKLGTGMVDLLVDASKLVNTVDFNDVNEERDTDIDPRSRNLFESQTPFSTPYMSASPGYFLDGMSGQTPIAGKNIYVFLFVVQYFHTIILFFNFYFLLFSCFISYLFLFYFLFFFIFIFLGSFTPTGGQSPYMNPVYSPG